MSDDLFDLILYIPLTIFQLRPNKKYVCFSLHDILKIPKMSDDKKMNATLKIGVVSALLETFLSFYCQTLFWSIIGRCTLFTPGCRKKAPIWSPYSKLQINQVEKNQRTAAGSTCRRWRNTSSVSQMLDELEWPSLEAHRDRPPCFSFIRYILVLCL